MPTVEYTEKGAGESAILNFFGLREQPFGVTPDPRFLYLTASHREALATLVYGIESRRGFSVLVAEPGMGKTTLLFFLLDKLKSTARTAFLFRPDGNTKELLESLLLDLGLDADPEDVPQMHETLKGALLEDRHAGKHFVWVIDEAQDLDTSVLEAVRLLSNFETTDSKLMHILLAGQPGLAEKLGNPELLQLRQRISSFVQLSPLSAHEVSEYMRFRIRRGGGKLDELFSHEAQTLIAQGSHGIPRNVNSICFSCMSLAFAEGHKMIRPDVVREVLAEREPENAPKEPPAPIHEPETAWWPGDFLSADLGTAYAEPDTRHMGRSLGLLAVGLLVLPLLLVVMESSSRLGALETIRGPVAEAAIARLTGYDIHTPELPAATAPAFQAPKPPVPLPDSESDFEAQTAPQVAAETNHPVVPIKQAVKANSLPAPTPKQKGVSRVIFAHRGDTLYELARKYYGRSDGVLVGRIRSHNPQIRDVDTILDENQPVVLPDLAPEFPWKIGGTGGAGH
jgi:general secretion pathway protein A